MNIDLIRTNRFPKVHSNVKHVFIKTKPSNNNTRYQPKHAFD